MKTIGLLRLEQDEGGDLGELLDALGATRVGPGSWFLNCGEIDETVLLLVLPDDGDDLEALIRASVSAGRRVIGVWRQGAADAALPPALAEYGGGAVGWSPETLRRIICREAADWQGADGQARGDQGTKRNVC